MPVSKRTPVDQQATTPDRLRPYIFHGVDLTPHGSHATGDCPFCWKDGKFSVDVATGLWRCFVCGAGSERGGGNGLTFTRLIYDLASQSILERSRGIPAAFLANVSADRRLLFPATVAAWGVAAVADGTWLLPGYGAGGRLDQVYRRIRIKNKDEWVWRLLPTPGIWPEGKVHALHLPISDFDPARPRVDVMEGPWDGMAYWEVARPVDSNVIAVPGCNVWREEWTELCRGKHVTLWFDSDHPRVYRGRTSRAGFDGMYRIAKRLGGIAASVRWVRWGKEGYDPTRPDGWDVRDHLSEATDRRKALADLLEKIEPAPAEWFLPTHATLLNGQVPHTSSVESQQCCTWSECNRAWQDALEWRDELSSVLSVMLAVAASTNQSGDNQLFLQVIGDPGSAKTRMCKGLLVSATCKLILHLKSFHSGWKGEDGKDCSLVSRINGLCLVTPEADALSIGMSWEQLNSQMRQIFDGESGHTYGNSSDDVRYRGLRSPWIQAGTPALMDKDQSRLGDRFLRIRIEEPTQDIKRSIMLRSLRNERLAVVETSNGTESSIISPKLRAAYALTGGYVDWLRAHIEENISLVDMDDEAEQQCCDLAELTADMRARPNMDPRKHEVHHTKELGSRLAGQFGRLALCLAVVLNKHSADAEVIRTVRKVALDTAHGHSLNIVRWLCSPNPKAGGRTYQECGGLMEGHLRIWTEMSSERLLNYLMFLRKIGVLELKKSAQTNGLWLLTERVYSLYLRVVGS